MKNLLILASVIALIGCFYETQPTAYRVYYHANEITSGNPPVDTNTYKWGESAKILGKGNMQNKDYTFLGWRFFGNHYYPNDNITINYDDINLYAVWDDGYDSPFSFVIENNEVKITRFNEITNNPVTIPETLQGKNVTVIDDNVFNNTSISGVTLPKYLKHIGVGAFASCKITQVIIPDSVEYIGHVAFQNNNLIKVTLGSGITAIEPLTFRKNKLEEITIPENIKTIGAGAFHENEIEMVKISADVTITDNTSFGVYGESFKAYYDAQGKSAGLYLYSGDTWGIY